MKRKREKNISYLFDRLIRLSIRLRGPKGCSWDRSQTHKSLKGDLIEEAYEVAEAIDEKDNHKLVEELGDLLYQVVFHARIAAQEGRFTLNDILDTVYQKMRRRHPHVFGAKKEKSHKELLKHWEEIKLAEKNHKTHAGIMKGFSRSMPALLRARAVQERAKRVGFEWQDETGCFEKLTKEMQGLKRMLKKRKIIAIEEEIGDVLFTMVNLSRYLKLNPEEILQRSTDKFIRRFEEMEKEIEKKGKKLSALRPKELDTFWKKATAGILSPLLKI